MLWNVGYVIKLWVTHSPDLCGESNGIITNKELSFIDFSFDASGFIEYSFTDSRFAESHSLVTVFVDSSFANSRFDKMPVSPNRVSPLPLFSESRFAESRFVKSAFGWFGFRRSQFCRLYHFADIPVSPILNPWDSPSEITIGPTCYNARHCAETSILRNVGLVCRNGSFQYKTICTGLTVSYFIQKRHTDIEFAVEVHSLHYWLIITLQLWRSSLMQIAAATFCSTLCCSAYTSTYIRQRRCGVFTLLIYTVNHVMKWRNA